MRMTSSGMIPDSFKMSDDKTTITVPVSHFSANGILLAPNKAVILEANWPLRDVTDAGIKVRVTGNPVNREVMMLGGYVDGSKMQVAVMNVSESPVTVVPDSGLVLLEFFEPVKVLKGSQGAKFGVLHLDAPKSKKAAPKRRAKKK